MRETAPLTVSCKQTYLRTSFFFFFSSRRRHTRSLCDWSSDVCSSDLQSGFGVGGAALHYFANFPRLLPNDFKMKSEYGRAQDWPISYADVAPYYDRVAHEIGVSGDAKAEEIWRPKGEPYPMPPMKTFRNGQVWLKGLEAVGIRMVPQPVGMNSIEFKGRPACIYDGWCHVGCPIGALANPVVT